MEKQEIDYTAQHPAKPLFELLDPRIIANKLQLELPEIHERVACIEKAQYVPQETWNFEFII